MPKEPMSKDMTIVEEDPMRRELLLYGMPFPPFIFRQI